MAAKRWKPIAKYMKITSSDKERKVIGRLLHEAFPHLPQATAAKMILLQLAENPDLFAARLPQVTSGYREIPAVTGGNQQSPAVPTPSPPPRARSGSGEYINNTRSTQSAPAREAPDVQALVAELHGLLNSKAGTEHPSYDPAAERALVMRLGLVPGTVGPAATVEQVRRLVAHYAEAWAGTPYARGLHLRGLLGDRFWERHGAMSAPTTGKGNGETAEDYRAKLAREMRAQEERQDRERRRAEAIAEQARGMITDLADGREP